VVTPLLLFCLVLLVDTFMTIESKIPKPNRSLNPYPYFLTIDSKIPNHNTNPNPNPNDPTNPTLLTLTLLTLTVILSIVRNVFTLL